MTVIEREDVPGGRNGLLELDSPAGGTYRFDTGPTVLTMPDLIADALTASRRELARTGLGLTLVDLLYSAATTRMDRAWDVRLMLARWRPRSSGRAA